MTVADAERERARQRQQKRRQGRARIDYYPNPEALAAINALRTPGVGGDASSIINLLVRRNAKKRP